MNFLTKDPKLKKKLFWGGGGCGGGGGGGEGQGLVLMNSFN